MSEKRLLVVVGPTGSGKSELALRLAAELGGEIVSADSVQVYRGFDIGSAKPSAEERARVPHHLLDVVEPDAAMDAARWAELAAASVDDIFARGRQPIVCGGSFLWVRALLFGLAPAPPAQPAIRERHQRLAAERGPEALFAELAQKDPESAARLNPRDIVRVSRALEVFELSGKPLSEWHAAHGFRDPRYAHRLLGVSRTQEELDARLRARTLAMFEAGWVEEVRRLLEAGHAGTRPMGAVGYKQISQALLATGETDPATLLEPIVRATRIFARRQRTWLREQAVEWLAPGAAPSKLLP